MVLDLFVFVMFTFLIKLYFNNNNNNKISLHENVLKWERFLKKRRSTILGGNSSLPINLLIYTRKNLKYIFNEKFNELKMLKPVTAVTRDVTYPMIPRCDAS